MGRLIAITLVALVVAGISVAAATPATGSETLDGVIIVSGASGGRDVVTSVVVMKGVFRGTGRVVEIPNLPGDPDNISRDDLVFADGTIHLVTTTLDFAFSINPRSCTITATVQQTAVFAGGTGRFAAATGSFAGTLTGHAVAARNADGSCSMDQALLHEQDHFSSSGTMSF